MEYYSAIKKKQTNVICSNMDGIRDSHTDEVSQKEKDKYHLISLIFGIYNMAQMILSTEQKKIMDMVRRLVVTRREGGGSGMDGEYGVGRYKLLYLEWISNGILLCSTGNYVQSPGVEHDGRQYKKKDVYMYDWVTMLWHRS